MNFSNLFTGLNYDRAFATTSVGKTGAYAGVPGSPAALNAIRSKMTPEQLHRSEFMSYYGLNDPQVQEAKWDPKKNAWYVIGDAGSTTDEYRGYGYYVSAPNYSADWTRPGSAPKQQEVVQAPTAIAPPKPTAEQDAINAITSKGSRYDAVSGSGQRAYDVVQGATGSKMPGRAGSAGEYMADKNGFLASQWDPSLYNVDPSTMTVEQRMAAMLNSNNPYLQAAQSQAMQQANTRGLLNTSMAVGAGTQAMMNTAMPIAQQDAQTYLQQQLANQQFENQAGQYNATTQNQLNQTGYQAFLGSEEADRQAQRQGDLNAQMEQLKANTMLLDEDIKTRLASLQQDYAIELETLKQSYNIMENRDTQMGTMYSEALNSMAGFLNRAELTPQQQSAGIKVIIDNLNAGLQFMAGIGSAQAVNQYQSNTSYVPPVPG